MSYDRMDIVDLYLSEHSLSNRDSTRKEIQGVVKVGERVKQIKVIQSDDSNRAAIVVVIETSTELEVANKLQED